MGAIEGGVRLERSGVPLYIQVAGLLRKRLEAGEWVVGDRIPTIDEFMAEYNVARVTLRQAMAQLEADGLVKRGQGRGTFVTGDATKDRWLILPTEWDALVSHVDRLGAEIEMLGTDDAAPTIRSEEGVLCEAYWHARRLNRSDGQAYSLTDVYLARSVFDRDPAAFRSRPVLPLLARLARRSMRRAAQVLTVSTADVETARQLQVAVGTPITEVRRTVVDASGRLLYVADVRYPARHLRIETVLFDAAGASKTDAASATRRPAGRVNTSSRKVKEAR